MEALRLAAVAAALLAYGVISRRAERSVLTPPLFFVAVGFLLGEGGLGVDLGILSGGIHLLAELTLVLVLFTDAARIHLDCLRREESLPARLLGVGMPLTVAAGGAVGFLLFPELGLWGALLLAAMLAPTDAALGQAVVSNPLVPLRIRQSLNVESGLNDGIAVPLVLLFAFAAASPDAGIDPGRWLGFAARALTLGPLVGVAVGVFGGRLVDRGIERGWINEPFERLSVLGLAGLAFAGAEIVGGNGFIAAFVAGLALGNSTRGVCSRLYDFGEAEGQLLSLLVFVAFGGVLVPAALAHATPAALVYALASLTLVRMLPVILSLVGSGLRPASVAFLGWFGPRGLASIVFVLLVAERGGIPGVETLETVVVLTVLASTVLHGVTAYPLAQRYGALVGEAGDEPEHAGAMDLPVRVRHAGDHS